MTVPQRRLSGKLASRPSTIAVYNMPTISARFVIRLIAPKMLQYAMADLERLSIDLVDLEAKRDRLAGELMATGYDLRIPEGTFYLWTRSPEPDDVAFCRRLADRKVLALPGTICEAPGHVRISLTASNEMIDRALPVFRAAGAATRRG